MASAGLGLNVQSASSWVAGGPQVLFIQPMSLHASVSAIPGAEAADEVMPARVASAAAWVIVACAARISP